MKPNRYLATLLAATCLAALPAWGQPEEIAGEMRQITASLQEARNHLANASRKQEAIGELTKVKEASERAQKLEPSGAAKAEGERKEAVATSYRLNLQLMIDVVKAASTAAELDQPQTALLLLRALDPMSAPTHSQPFK